MLDPVFDLIAYLTKFYKIFFVHTFECREAKNGQCDCSKFGKPETKGSKPDKTNEVACRLGKQLRQIKSTRQVITSVGNQSAYIESRLLTFVTSHRTVTFFHPPADTAFTAIVGSV
jgi:hypothetical protein